MNREIKFRGKRIDNGEWVYGLFARVKIGSLIVPAIHREREWDYGDYVEYLEVDGETVGQYTGRKSQDGIEIYEDDVIIGEAGIPCKVEWLPDYARFHAQAINIRLCTISSEAFIRRKIIGNVHDNPELLGGESHG